MDGEQRFLNDVLDLRLSASRARQNMPHPPTHMRNEGGQQRLVGDLIAIERQSHQAAPFVFVAWLAFVHAASIHSGRTAVLLQAAAPLRKAALREAGIGGRAIRGGAAFSPGAARRAERHDKKMGAEVTKRPPDAYLPVTSVGDQM